MLTECRVPVELRRMAGECPEALNDEELMLVLGSVGEHDGEQIFGELFRRYQSRVVRWCFRMTRNRSRALDLGQEVFFKAFRHRQSFRGDSRFSTWLYAIARNHCLSSLKKIADPADAGDPVPPRLCDGRTLQPDLLIERSERYREMMRMMDAALEPLEARVMTLHYGFEMPLATITQRLALRNPSGAKAYVVNARRKLNVIIKRRGLCGTAAAA